MTSKPRDFLDFAEGVLRAGGIESAEAQEAAWRTSIHLAYYGSFHKMCHFLRVRKPTLAIPQSRAHTFVREQMLALAPKLPMDAPISWEERVVDKLAKLCKMREKADYELAKNVRAAEASKAIRKAKKIFDILDTA